MGIEPDRPIEISMSNISIQDVIMKVSNESDTVTRIQLGEREIILMGTAHVSSESVEQVAEAIRQESPDRVCVEIDSGRYQSLTKTDNWQQMNLNKVFREKKGFLLLANLALSSFQRKVGMNSGGEARRRDEKGGRSCDRTEYPFLFQ